MAKKLPLHFEIELYPSLESLDADWQRLVARAQLTSYDAYAPYSNFHVGAAALLDNGDVIAGNNQENASYPQGLCAERVALFYIGAHFTNISISRMAVVAQPGKEGNFVPVSPCGGCRQVMSEYRQKQGSPIELLLPAEKDQFYLIKDVNQLLPLTFNKQLLLQTLPKKG